MPQMIFVNLPTRDLTAADTFYGALGFEKNTTFSDENASSWMVDPNIWIMCLKEDFFSTFLRDGETARTGNGGQQMINALSCDSREHVDELARLASTNGGAIYREAEEPFPGMYSAAVKDPDGHVWEFVWMDMSGDVPTEESGE
jgi:uncharacterized protein